MGTFDGQLASGRCAARTGRTSWRLGPRDGALLALAWVVCACDGQSDPDGYAVYGQPAPSPGAQAGGPGGPAPINLGEASADAGTQAHTPGFGPDLPQAGMGAADDPPQPDAAMDAVDGGMDPMTANPSASAGDGWSGFECVSLAPLQPSALHERLAELSGAVPAQVAGQTVTIAERNTAEGRRLARAYLTERYQALGHQVIEQTYASGANLIAGRAGREPLALIVSAHLDAVPGSPGADDDASGLITGLAIAEALVACPLQYGLRLLAFDEEERGLIGAQAYANEVLTSGGVPDLLGMLHFEMTGHDSDGDGRYMIVDCSRPDGVFLTEAVTTAVQDLMLPLLDTRYCTGASDHQAFWDLDVPAIVVGQAFFGTGADPNPCYHASCDDVDQLDFEYMSALTTASARAVAELIVAR